MAAKAVRDIPEVFTISPEGISRTAAARTIRYDCRCAHGFFVENTHIHVAYFLKNTHIDVAALGTANSLVAAPL